MRERDRYIVESGRAEDVLEVGDGVRISDVVTESQLSATEQTIWRFHSAPP